MVSHWLQHENVCFWRSLGFELNNKKNISLVSHLQLSEKIQRFIICLSQCQPIKQNLNQKREKRRQVNRCLAGEYCLHVWLRASMAVKISEIYLWVDKKKDLVSEHLYTITQKMTLTQDDRDICDGRSERITICTKSSFSVSIPPQSCSHHCPPPLCGVLYEEFLTSVRATV